MTLNLANYENEAKEAVKFFWQNREKSAQTQINNGTPDAGSRGSVTNGKNMDRFVKLIIDIVRGNGLTGADIYSQRPLFTLPGYFRPTKQWDLLVMNKGHLVAAIELKSQVGSFGNNCNNRTEEAIGTALDLWTAYREGAFGQQPRPFVGWLILVEDSPLSRKTVQDRSPHFPIFKEFKGASYLKRYEILCQRLVQEQLYTTAAVLTSPSSAKSTGAFSSMSSMTSLDTFVTSLAGHVAAESMRK